MAVDQTLVDKAADVQKAASKVAAANASSSRSFYARDGWVWFGDPDRVDSVVVARLGGRLFASLSASIDVIALNAVLNGARAAKQADDGAKAQVAYDQATVALKQAAK